MESEALVDPRVRRTQRDVIRAATEILLDAGWTAVTHAEVARRSGYAKATIYSHWPTQVDLVRSAFDQLCELDDHHHTPTGDLREDLVGELLAFTDALTNGRLAPALGGLVERSATDTTISPVLEQMHDKCNGVLRTVLRDHLAPADVEPTLLMLSGAVYFRTAFLGRPPTRKFIEDLVDRALRSIDR